jgi:hypothetical protein
VQLTLQQGWSSAEWEAYGAEHPECYEYVNYFWNEWSVKGGPRLPLPRIGQPLASGEVVTAEWLAAAQNEHVGSNNVEEASSELVMPADVQSPTSLCDDRTPASQETTPTLEQTEQDSSIAGTGTPADPSIVSGLTSVCTGAQLADDVMNATAADGRRDAVAGSTQTVGDSMTNILADMVAYNSSPTFRLQSPKTPDVKHWLDDSLLRPLALKTSPEPDPDEADVWPDAEDLRAAVALYATDMRDESIDGVGRCTGSSFGDSSRDPAKEYAYQKQSSIGGAVEAEDEEDVFGDIPSGDAVASPSSCRQRELEASEKGSEAQEVVDSVAHSGRSNAHAGVSDAGIVLPSVPTRKPYRSPAAEDRDGSGHPAEVMRQLALHVRKVNDLLGFASETAMLPPDVFGHFHAVRAANNAMLDALKSNQIRDPDLHVMNLEPSAGSQLCYATPFCVRCCVCCVC